MTKTPDDFELDNLSSPRSAQQREAAASETIAPARLCECGQWMAIKRVDISKVRTQVDRQCGQCHRETTEVYQHAQPIYIRTRVRLLENNYLDVFVETFYDLKEARGGHELLVYQGHGTWEWRSEDEVINVTRHS